MTSEPLTEQQLDAIFLFPYCNQPEVRRTGMEAPWPWLGGTPKPEGDNK